MLQAAYRRVARRDPEWFDQYVIKSLTDEPNNSGRGVSRLVQAHQAQLGEEELLSDDSSPQLQDLLDELAVLERGRTAFEEALTAAAEKNVKVTQSVNVPNVFQVQASGTAAQSGGDDGERARARIEADVSRGESATARSISPGRDDATVPFPPRPLGTKPHDSDEIIGQATASLGLESESPVESSLPIQPEETLVSDDVVTPDAAPSPTVALSASPESRYTSPTICDVSASSSSSASIIEDEGRAVAYFDTFRRSWSSVPLKIFLELGYRENEVTLLQPEALELIAKESISRPRSGLPPRWKLSGTETLSSQQLDANLVSILPGDEVDAFLDKQQQTEVTSGSASATNEIPRERRKSISEETGAEASTRRSSRSRVHHAPGESRRDPQKARRSRGGDRLVDGRPKPIYSGRPTPLTERAAELPDPPKPTSFWPDIDSFRGMLRNEAALRLRILGDDWSGVVKDESDWRLGLYKKWLWMLHNGIGEPLVESRSDRMRRMRTTRSLDSETRKSAASVRSPPLRARGRRNT
jgi:hypothetical protein